MISALVTLITLYEGCIILRAILSWFTSPNSTNPAFEFLERLTDPVLEPVRRALPTSSGIDLSPLIVLLGLELVKRILL